VNKSNFHWRPAKRCRGAQWREGSDDSAHHRLIAGKGLAAELAGHAFKYTRATRLTMWSLTLPQVAATLAATLVAFNTFDPAGQRLIGRRMLDVVLVLMLTTSHAWAQC
jgi:hypothetical protein